MTEQTSPEQAPVIKARVRLVRETVMSGRGGYPSIAYRCLLVDAYTGTVLGKTGTVDGVLRRDAWRSRGAKLAARRGYEVVS